MQKKYQRRYFKDTSAVKSFISALLHDYLNGEIKESIYKNALSAANVLLKCTTQEYYENRLGPLQDKITELQEAIKNVSV